MNRYFQSQYQAVNKTLLLAVLMIAGLTSGCASITGTPNQSVSVQTREQSGGEVRTANCELTNNKGKWFVTTPGSVMITRSNDDMQVLCNKTGFESGRGSVVSEVKASMFGNIIFGGGIGAIIDHSSGAAYEYPTFIQVLMGAKIESPKAQDQPAPTSDGVSAQSGQSERASVTSSASPPTPAVAAPRAPVSEDRPCHQMAIAKDGTMRCGR